jgi:hypothetical protein
MIIIKERYYRFPSRDAGGFKCFPNENREEEKQDT